MLDIDIHLSDRHMTSCRKFKNPDGLQFVFDSQDLCCPLPDNDAGRHSVAGGHAWHHGPIGDAKVVDAVDFEVAIHYTRSVLPHFGRGCLVPKAKRCVADVVFQLWTLQVAGNDLSADKRTKSVGVTYLPTKFYTCESGLPIIWVTE